MNTSNQTTKLPNNLKKYFWDCDFESLNIKEYPVFIIERILNFGNLDSVRWLSFNTDETTIIRIINKSRNLTKKTKNYWETMLG